jgi:hypothetical protein
MQLSRWQVFVTVASASFSQLPSPSPSSNLSQLKDQSSSPPLFSAAVHAVVPKGRSPAYTKGRVVDMIAVANTAVEADVVE